MTLGITHTSYHTLVRYCKEGKKLDYPITKILLNQIPLKNEEETLRLFARGMKENWWNAEELIQFLEETPIETISHSISKEINHYLATLTLEFSLEKRVSLIWCSYISTRYDSKFIFYRMKKILESHEFDAGFRIVRNKFRLLESTRENLEVPFDGDLSKVMQAAMDPNPSLELEKGLLQRMELRWMENYYSSLSRFNNIIEKLDRKDCEAWKIASRVLLKGADTKFLTLILDQLKQFGCVDETILVLQHALRYDIKFDPQYGYWCAEQLFYTDLWASIELVKGMGKSKYFNSEINTELQVKLYCNFALALEEEGEALEWMTSALSHQDQKFWNGLEDEIVNCAELCQKMNKLHSYRSFLAKIKKTVTATHPLFERVCRMWATTRLGSCHTETLGTLLGYSPFLISRMEDKNFRQEVCSVVEFELENNAKAPENCLEILILYGIRNQNYWSKIIKNIQVSESTVLQRKVCQAWLNFPMQEVSYHWQSISGMVHHCHIAGLRSVVELIQEANLPITFEILNNLAQSSLTILKQNKKAPQEEKQNLLNSLYKLIKEKCPKPASDQESIRCFNLVLIPLANCLLIHGSYESIDTCCNLLIANLIKFSLDNKMFPFNIYNQLLHYAGKRSFKKEDQVFNKLIFIASEIPKYPTPSMLLQTAGYYFKIDSVFFKALCADSVNFCFSDQYFNELTDNDIPQLMSFFKELINLENPTIDVHISSCLYNNRANVLSLFKQKNLPEIICNYLDRKIIEFNQKIQEEIHIQVNNLYLTFLYAENLYANGPRGKSLDHFIDFFLKTFFSLQDLDQMKKVLTEIDSIFDATRFENIEQKKRFAKHAIHISKRFLERLRHGEKNSKNSIVLYRFLVSELLNQIDPIKKSKSYERIPKDILSLFEDFCASWEIANVALFPEQIAAVSIIACTLIEKKHDSIAKGILCNVIDKAISFLGDNFNVVNLDEAKNLLICLQEAFNILKYTISPQDYCDKLTRLAFCVPPQDIDIYSDFINIYLVLYVRVKPEIPLESLKKRYALIDMLIELKDRDPRFTNASFQQVFLELIKKLSTFETDASFAKIIGLFLQYKDRLDQVTILETFNKLICLNQKLSLYGPFMNDLASVAIYIETPHPLIRTFMLYIYKTAMDELKKEKPKFGALECMFELGIKNLCDYCIEMGFTVTDSGYRFVFNKLLEALESIMKADECCSVNEDLIEFRNNLRSQLEK